MNQSSKFGTQPRLLSYLAGAIAPALLAMAGSATAQAPVGVGGAAFVPTAAITMPGGQKISSFDISFVDPVISTYVLADRTNKSIDVVNTQTNTLVKQLFANFAGFTGNNDTSGPDGVMIIDHTQVWAGDAGSLLKIIDLASGALLNTINTGGVNRVDEMCFDPVHRIAMMANNADDPPFVTFVSANPGNAILKKLPFDGSNGTPHATNGIEQCQWSPQTGKFIIAVPEINGNGVTPNVQPGGVSVIDPITLSVDTTFIVTTPSCRGPQGTAIGPNFELALNCNATSTSVIIDVRNGSLIAALSPQTGGGDMVWYNPGDNRYFFANANNGLAGATAQWLAVVNEGNIFNFNANTAQIVITRTTQGGNVHSVAADPVRNQVYVPISNGANAGLCSAGGGNEAQGCIVVLTNPDDTMCNVGGSPVIQVQNDNSPSFFRTLCLLHAVP